MAVEAIACEHLLVLLNPRKTYFDGRGLVWPPLFTVDGIDCDQLVNCKD